MIKFSVSVSSPTVFEEAQFRTGYDTYFDPHHDTATVMLKLFPNQYRNRFEFLNVPQSWTQHPAASDPSSHGILPN